MAALVKMPDKNSRCLSAFLTPRADIVFLFYTLFVIEVDHFLGYFLFGKGSMGEPLFSLGEPNFFFKQEVRSALFTRNHKNFTVFMSKKNSINNLKITFYSVVKSH